MKPWPSVDAAEESVEESAALGLAVFSSGLLSGARRGGTALVLAIGDAVGVGGAARRAFARLGCSLRSRLRRRLGCRLRLALAGQRVLGHLAPPGCQGIALTLCLGRIAAQSSHAAKADGSEPRSHAPRRCGALRGLQHAASGPHRAGNALRLHVALVPRHRPGRHGLHPAGQGPRRAAPPRRRPEAHRVRLMGAAATAELETFERADLDAQLRLAELHAEAGYNPNAEAIRKMVERGLGPMAGAAQGLNPAVFMNTVPAPGSYAIDQGRFDLLTERNDLPQTSDAWPGFQARVDRRVANVGVLANIRIHLNLSVVVSGTG